MTTNGRRPISISFRSDRKLDDILRNVDLPIYDIVEAGLLSMAKIPGGTKNQQLTLEAIRLAEDRLAFYAQRIEDLKKIRDMQPTQSTADCRAVSDPVPAPAPKKFYNLEERILVKNKECPSDGKYFVTRPQYERQKDILEICKDDDES